MAETDDPPRSGTDLLYLYAIYSQREGGSQLAERTPQRYDTICRPTIKTNCLELYLVGYRSRPQISVIVGDFCSFDYTLSSPSFQKKPRFLVSSLCQSHRTLRGGLHQNLSVPQSSQRHYWTRTRPPVWIPSGKCPNSLFLDYQGILQEFLWS